MCEEWCDVTPGDLPMWLMVKNYLLQYILLEATYLRSTCCVSGRRLLLLLLAVRFFFQVLHLVQQQAHHMHVDSLPAAIGIMWIMWAMPFDLSASDRFAGHRRS